MEQPFPPSPKHPVTEEGIAAHWAAEKVMYSWLPVNSAAPLPLSQFLGIECPLNGVFITDDMIWGGGVYLEAIWARAHSYLPGLKIEHQTSLPDSTGPISGRIDAKWSSEDQKRLALFDFKFGYTPVEVVENWQLIIYALGSVTMHTEEIEFVIVQPRGPHSGEPVKTWTITADDLRELYRWVDNSIKLARGENPPTHPGAWCRYCRAAAHCDALDRSTYRALEETGKAVVVEMSEAQIAVDLEAMHRATSQIKARLMALEALAIARIQGGQPIPGFAYQPSQGNRRWTLPDKQIIAAAKLFGIDIETVTAASPNQAEGRKLPRNIIDLYTERPTNAPKLKKINLQNAKEAFRT